ncbi:MAG TPA: ATP-binding protein [Bryobacteraceae bacterium]|nr:ATP-binding protein [Bryobacteraceae bacterium]
MPFTASVFRKLFLSSLALIALTLVTVDFYWTGYAADQQADALKQRLAGVVQVLRSELDAIAPGGLQAWALAADKRSGVRITVVDPAGAVLADSQQNPALMENHGQRPEIREAYAGRVGTATRRSATIDRDLFYVALPLVYQGHPGYALRAAAPLGELTSAVTAVRWRILEISLIAAAVALLMAFWFSRGLARRVRRLQRFADNLVQERPPEELPRDADDELGALAASLNRTAVRLRDFIDRLSVESSRREAILASMVEGVLAVDNEMRVMFCNPAFAQAVNAAPPVPERLPVLELVRDPVFLDILSRAVVTGQSVVERMQVADAGGRAYAIHAAPLTHSSRGGAIAVLHDVTDLERLERVRRDFVANVSHELRTPLTAISGYAETLLDGAIEDPENNRRFIEIIRAHSIRLNNIASDLLTLSELESGRPDAPPEPVSLRASLETAARVVESEARVRGVALVWGQVDDAFIMGHRIRLEQSIVNLLDNAVKFNRPGGEVRIEAVSLAGGRARIAISDTGIGIPSEDQPRIFERFYRVDKARSRAVGGTGLGLSIVKHVVERMGGSVTVESQLGKGSKFFITLPEAASEPHA